MDMQQPSPSDISSKPTVLNNPSKSPIILLLVSFSVIAVSAAIAYLAFNQDTFQNYYKIPTIGNLPPSDGIPRSAIERRVTYTGDIPIIYEDVNKYLQSKNRSLITPNKLPTITNKDLLSKLSSDDADFIVIDIREARETEVLLRLNDYPQLRYIRLGDLINNNYEEIPKNEEIIIVGFTENRETIAADYLIGQGYTNITILKEGLLKWALDLMPTTKNRYTGEYVVHNDINAVLPYIKTPSPDSSILNFGPYQEGNITLLTMDSKQLSDYIASLPTDKQYVLKCEENKFCYEASHFWYVAQNSIQIIGYTGFDDYLPQN